MSVRFAFGLASASVLFLAAPLVEEGRADVLLGVNAEYTTSATVTTTPTDGGGTATATGATATFGRNGTGNNVSNLVFVFQLPEWGNIANPFVTADFTAYIKSQRNTFSGTVDLYGLTARSTSAPAASDFFVGGNDVTGATKLMDTFQADTGTNPADGAARSTNAAGDLALRNYLNAQYAGGAGAGDFVFLRLSHEALPASFKEYTFYTAEQAGTSLDPVITCTAVPEPASVLIALGASMLLIRRRGSSRN